MATAGYTKIKGKSSPKGWREDVIVPKQSLEKAFSFIFWERESTKQNWIHYKDSFGTIIFSFVASESLWLSSAVAGIFLWSRHLVTHTNVTSCWSSSGSVTALPSSGLLWMKYLRNLQWLTQKKNKTKKRTQWLWKCLCTREIFQVFNFLNASKTCSCSKKKNEG